MLARSCLRSTRIVGAVRNGAINTSKVRLSHHRLLYPEPSGLCDRKQLKEEYQMLTMGVVACRIHRQRCRSVSLQIECGRRSSYCRGNWINWMVLPSVWLRITCHDAHRRRVSPGESSNLGRWEGLRPMIVANDQIYALLDRRLQFTPTQADRVESKLVYQPNCHRHHKTFSMMAGSFCVIKEHHH